MKQVVSLTLAVLCLAALAGAQSLGDIARQQRLQKSAPQTKPRVLTNEDMPATDKPATASNSDSKSATAADKSSYADTNEDSAKPSAAEVQAKIKNQKERVASLEDHIQDIQAQMDKWKGSDCTHIFYYEHPYQNTCDEPKRLAEEHDRAESQLEKEKSALTDMQERARKLGYGNSVYDPE